MSTSSSLSELVHQDGQASSAGSLVGRTSSVSAHSDAPPPSYDSIINPSPPAVPSFATVEDLIRSVKELDEPALIQVSRSYPQLCAALLNTPSPPSSSSPSSISTSPPASFSASRPSGTRSQADVDIDVQLMELEFDMDNLLLTADHRLGQPAQEELRKRYRSQPSARLRALRERIKGMGSYVEEMQRRGPEFRDRGVQGMTFDDEYGDPMTVALDFSTLPPLFPITHTSSTYPPHQNHNESAWARARQGRPYPSNYEPSWAQQGSREGQATTRSASAISSVSEAVRKAVIQGFKCAAWAGTALAAGYAAASYVPSALETIGTASSFARRTWEANTSLGGTGWRSSWRLR